MRFLGTLLIVFIVLRLCRVILWPWSLVLLPGYALLFLLLIIIIVAIADEL